jgi:FkbM family methyltransferase
MRNLCARYLCYSGTYEVNETRYLKQQVKPGDVAIDVGSHIGYFALLFSRLIGPQGMVYACEPDPSMFKEVLKNLTLNNIKNVDALELALGDHDGTVGMAGSAGNETGNYHIVPTGTIPLETLDHFVERKNIKRVDWIKADIEGAEVGMLRGGRATLLKWRPRLLLELNPEGLTQMGTSAEELISELSETGYELFQAHRTGLERFSRIPPMGEHINLIAIPR